MPPLVIIVFALAALNLEHLVFDLMGGILPEQRSANDAACQVLLMLSFLSVFALPFLISGCLYSVVRAWRKGRETPR